MFGGTSADEKEGKGGRTRGEEVCERLTFPFLLGDLVVVKRLLDFSTWRGCPPLQPVRGRASIGSEGCARRSTQRHVSFSC